MIFNATKLDLFIAAIPLLVFVITVIVGYVVRKILFKKLINWSQNTVSPIDDIILESTNGPLMIWFIMLGLYFGLAVSKLPQELIRIVNNILFILGVFSVTLVLVNIATKAIKIYSAKIQNTLPITSLTQNISRIIIFMVGIMVILNHLGVSITPILATLGVGGLAVALALQDTLSNLFAGLYIILAKQVRVGDYVKLDSGEEGYITDITWRTTTIRMLPNNLVLVPNEKLTKSIITNFYLPSKELAVLVNLGVHYASDLDRVEEITRMVAKEVMQEVQGAVPEFEPFIRYNAFGDFAVNFTVILRAREFVDQYFIKHEFIKRLHKRYAKEKIKIPYPIRTINYEQEKIV